MKKLYIFLLVAFLSSCQNSGTGSVEINLFSDGLLAIETNQRWGYINNKGEMKIQAVYDLADPFIGGTAIVESGANIMLIDTNGKNLLDYEYDNLYRDIQTKNIFYVIGSKHGVLSPRGNKITEALFDDITDCSENLCEVTVGDKHGFIDSKGKMVVQPTYDLAWSFSNGLAAVKNNGKYGFINKEGETVIPFVYDDVKSDYDKNGNAIVDLNGRKILINKENEQIISNADDINSSGIIYSVEKSGEIRLHKSDGTLFSELVFTDVGYFQNYCGNFEYLLQDLNIIFTKDGTIAQRIDSYTSNFYEIYVNNSKTMAIAKSVGSTTNIYYDGGSFVIDCNQLAQSASNDRFVVLRDGKFGIVTREGETKLYFLYDGLLITDDGYIVYLSGDYLGVMDSKYNTIIPANYTDIYPIFIYYLD